MGGRHQGRTREADEVGGGAYPNARTACPRSDRQLDSSIRPVSRAGRTSTQGGAPMYRIVMFAGLVLACGSVALVPARAEDKPRTRPRSTPCRAMPRIDFWWARHKQFLEQTKKGGIEVMFLGDSITHGWEGQRSLAGTLRRLQAGQPRHRRRPDRPRPLAHHRGQGAGHLKPKAAVIMIGTNNIGGHSRRADRRRHQGHRRGAEEEAGHQDSACWASSRGPAASSRRTTRSCRRTS